MFGGGGGGWGVRDGPTHRATIGASEDKFVKVHLVDIGASYDKSMPPVLKAAIIKVKLPKLRNQVLCVCIL